VCRHLAYVGPPVTLAALLYEAPHSLVRQSWAPRHQRQGTVNVDGYGIGWYDRQIRPEPARYRRAGPVWADRSLASIAPVIRTGAVLAAVRSATPPAPSEESGAAPFTAGPWLWSLNGSVTADLNTLRGAVSPARSGSFEGVSDTEVLFGLLLDRLDGGATPTDAVAGLVAAIPGRLNTLLTDGQTIWATAKGDSLWWRQWRSGMVVASEPFDDEQGWHCVADLSLLTADQHQCQVTPLPIERPSPLNPSTHTTAAGGAGAPTVAEEDGDGASSGKTNRAAGGAGAPTVAEEDGDGAPSGKTNRRAL
jgi:glutamine amidotransferase